VSAFQITHHAFLPTSINAINKQTYLEKSQLWRDLQTRMAYKYYGPSGRCRRWDHCACNQTLTQVQDASTNAQVHANRAQDHTHNDSFRHSFVSGDAEFACASAAHTWPSVKLFRWQGKPWWLDFTEGCNSPESCGKVSLMSERTWEAPAAFFGPCARQEGFSISSQDIGKTQPRVELQIY